MFFSPYMVSTVLTKTCLCLFWAFLLGSIYNIFYVEKKMYPNIFGCTPCVTKIYRNLILKQTDRDGSSYRTIFIEPLDSQTLLHKTGISKYPLVKGQQLFTEFSWTGVISGSPHSQHSASLLSVYQIPSTLGMTRRWKHFKSKAGTTFSNLWCLFF